MMQLTELNAWQELEAHSHLQQLSTIEHFKNNNPLRNKRLTVSARNISIDFTNQRVNDSIVDLLLSLAHQRNLKEKIDDLLQGAFVNKSENRPALHTALRDLNQTPIWVNGRDISADILATWEKMQSFVNQIRAGTWLGFSGKPITDIVNIGIGGSDLGPRFCINALAEYVTDKLNFHFISDVDPNAFKNASAKLNPETTLFIVSSKSFTTKETLYNAKKALAWINNSQSIDNHFIAVTANIEKANQFGFNNTLSIWDWIGGRYSFCSAINFISAIAIGIDHFSELLAGANSMDQHFQYSNFINNLPVLLGLFGIWNNNFLHIHNSLILTYCQQLEYFVPYIQQLDMESNGKSIDQQGRAVNHATGPIVWGGLGNQAQHSYYQLLCQGTHKVAADFISLKSFENEIINEMCEGKKHVLTHGVVNPGDPNSFIPGNTPINHIKLVDSSPFTLGELIALYEHKIYVQAVIWDINPFDQPGVESAKRQQHIPSHQIF